MTAGSGGIRHSANESSLVTTMSLLPGFGADGDGKRIARHMVQHEFS
jgi:hypothetical protein